MSYKQFVVMAGIAGVLCAAPAVRGASDPLISLSVQQTEMSDVLKFIAAQSGTSVVIAPDVSTRLLNLDLQEVPLSECLDVILKPYGYGYRRVGKTIVVDQLEGLKQLGEVEPLQTKVFRFNYLNAGDVTNLVKGIMSPRGSVSVVDVSQVAGWGFEEGGGSEGGAEASKRNRDQLKGSQPKSSKTIVMQDIPERISRASEIFAEIDVKPKQVDIRAYFVELGGNALKDIGFNWYGSDQEGHMQTDRIAKFPSDDQLPPQSGPVTPDNDYSTIGGNGGAIADSNLADLARGGMTAGFLNTGGQFDIGLWITANQGNTDVNVLSAPRVLAQENQEAAILVGTRYPIISFKQEGNGNDSSTTTSLEYYERVGIQLNVVPQIADDKISMVVHPVVTERIRDESINVGTESAPRNINYPVIQTREAETRLLLNNGQTVAIGGLINDSRKEGVTKVPFLGDIPFLGRLFRRETTINSKVDLVIFLTASTDMRDATNEAKVFNEAVPTSEKAMQLKWEEFYQKAKMDEAKADAVSAEQPEVVVEQPEAAAESAAPVVEPVSMEPAPVVESVPAAPAPVAPAPAAKASSEPKEVADIFKELSVK